MDANRFDSLTRLFASRRLSRRAAIAGAAGLLAAAGARHDAGAQVSQAQCGNKRCASDPGVCNDGCVCCIYPNGNNRCRPPGTCSPGTVVCPPGQVLGPSGVCAAPTTTTTTTTTSTTTSTTTPAPSPFQGTCPAGANQCATGELFNCNGGGFDCQCHQTTQLATICGKFDVTIGATCQFCGSDAECANITGNPNAACVTITSAVCPGCAETGGTACTIPCPLPV